jgi:hypothetical protein
MSAALISPLLERAPKVLIMFNIPVDFVLFAQKLIGV